MVAAQVSLRVEQGVMYGAAVLVGVDGIETALNRLQYHWARVILGCRRGPRLKWALCRAQCGWELRLGTRMLEQAFVARARRWVLAQGNWLASG